MRKWLTMSVVAIGFAAQDASAQEGALSRLYGQGVHAYYGGNLAGAEKLFTQAIDGGSQYPRLHYYRGLIYLQSGRKKAATVEFEKGAELEVSATRAYDVGLALERVQGRPRLALEEHRAARLASGVSATRSQRQVRQRAIESREPVTTVNPAPPTLDAITGDAAPIPAGTKPEVETPFADPMDAPAAAKAPEKAPAAAPAATEPAVEEPFGADEDMPADTEPATEPADDASPFGEEEAPAEEPAKDDTTPAPADDESPFGDDDAAPTGEEAVDETPAPTADDTAPPTEESPTDEATDPFGGDEAPAADEEKPATEEKAAEEPATEEADDADPFGS
jgi:hypothetical protein